MIERPDPAVSQGIVTLADQHYFPGLTLLNQSVQESWPLPIVCFDLGMTAEQKALAAEKCPRISIVPLPRNGLVQAIRGAFETAVPLAKPNKRVWPLWICPLLIAAAPFRRVFWLDCDIVVLRNLKGLFQLLDSGPVFTPENHAPACTPNKKELYEFLPIARSFDWQEPRVNGGVSGWDLVRDKDVLEAYIHPIERACEDSRIRNAISWHDQGALIWAIQKTGLEERVAKTTAWNLSVTNTSVATISVAWDCHILTILRERVPSANLLHWNGVRVPWAR